MSYEEKVQAIINAIQADNPTTATGRIMKQVILKNIPTLPPEQIDQLLVILGENAT